MEEYWKAVSDAGAPGEFYTVPTEVRLQEGPKGMPQLC